MNKRKKVLSYSLTLELLASLTLGQMLDIADLEDVANTRSLGNKTTALSFSQKLNLLLDIKTITKEERTKLDSFLGIRNQFMHNKAASTYFSAFKFINGINKVISMYPDILDKSDIDKALSGDEAMQLKVEACLEKCVEELFSDGMGIITDIKGNLKEKLLVKAERDVYKKTYDEKHKKLLAKNEEMKKEFQALVFKAKKLDLTATEKAGFDKLLLEAKKSGLFDSDT